MTRAPAVPKPTRFSHEAVAARLGEALVAFRDVDRPGFQGSGTLVEIDGLVVVATAAHVACEAYSRRFHPVPLRGVREDKMSEIQSGPDLVKCAWPGSFDKDDLVTPDVGLVVLDQEYIHRQPAVRPLTSREISTEEPTLDGALMHVLSGLPVGMIRGRVLHMETTTVHPKKSLGPLVPDLRPSLLQLDWSRIHPLGGGELIEAVDPPGISGGPLIRVREPTDGGLWSFEKHARLFGIACRHFKAEECIVAEHISSFTAAVARLREQCGGWSVEALTRR